MRGIAIITVIVRCAVQRGKENEKERKRERASVLYLIKN